MTWMKQFLSKGFEDHTNDVTKDLQTLMVRVGVRRVVMGVWWRHVRHGGMLQVLWRLRQVLGVRGRCDAGVRTSGKLVIHYFTNAIAHRAG